MSDQGTLFDTRPRPIDHGEYGFYGGTAPHEDPPTSIEAANRIESSANALRARVLEYLRARGQAGATDCEMQAALQMRHQTQTPRRRELVLAGLVVDSGRKRATDSGRSATVWVARG